jgi:AcrR family transcriptional regulator
MLVRGRDARLGEAAALFARQGYRATTLDDVAESLDIKKASLYHYIRSKEELLTEIYDRILTRIDATVRPIAESDIPADERLRRMVHAHLEVVTAERDMLAVVFREEAELSPDAKRAIRARKRDYERIFERVVDEGQQAGLLRPITTRLAVLALLGMCNWTYQWFHDPGDTPNPGPETFSAGEVAAEFVLLLEAGWQAGGDDGRRRAWPRPDTVAEAVAPVARALENAQAALEAASAELGHAADRFQDGLAHPSEPR